MSKLPPVEKIPLAVRKNLRDEWEAKKGDFEKTLSDLLTAEWTIEVDPKQLYAYAGDGYAKDSLGSCIAGYINGAIGRLKEFESKYEEEGLKEVNTIAHKHVMTMDVDLEKRFSYCGVDIHEGAIRLLFAPTCLGTNISYCLDADIFANALNNAPVPEGSDAKMSYLVRTSIRTKYDPKIEAIQKRIGEILAKPDIKLNPNFEDTYEKLLAESKVKKTELRDDWQTNFGYMAREYFDGVASQLTRQKFEDDELLQEGFHDVVDKGEIGFKIVDKLEHGSYGDAVVEDGILWVRALPKTWGTNVTYAAENLVDRL